MMANIVNYFEFKFSRYTINNCFLLTVLRSKHRIELVRKLSRCVKGTVINNDVETYSDILRMTLNGLQLSFRGQINELSRSCRLMDLPNGENLSHLELIFCKTL